MRVIFLLLIFGLLFAEIHGAGYVFATKTKIIGKFRQWICSWLTAAQYVTIIDTIEPNLNANTKMEDMQPMLINAAMAATTLSQKLSIAALGSKFLTRSGGITEPLNTFVLYLSNNILAFATQLIDMFVQFEARGETRQRIFQRGYRMVDIFMTKKRVATIYCRIQKGFNSIDTTDWPFIKSALGSVILFTTLDGLGTCT